MLEKRFLARQGIERLAARVVLAASLSRPLAEPLDLFWRIAPDVFWRIAPDGDSSTADAGAQDHASAGATAIAAGETTVEIAIADDADIEPARECFVVSR